MEYPLISAAYLGDGKSQQQAAIMVWRTSQKRRCDVKGRGHHHPAPPPNGAVREFADITTTCYKVEGLGQKTQLRHLSLNQRQMYGKPMRSFYCRFDTYSDVIINGFKLHKNFPFVLFFNLFKTFTVSNKVVD